MRLRIRNKAVFLVIWLLGAGAAGLGAAEKGKTMTDKIKKSDAELKKSLTTEQYQVTQCSATEAPFTGAYWNHHEKGVYKCVVCGADLFDSDTKFDSGTGWPSFYKPMDPASVDEKADKSLFMTRTEVVCHRCGAHLGHVFPDGPNPTGQRYCINSASLQFKKD